VTRATDDALARIGDKLAKARRRAFWSFRQDRRDFRLNPPLTAQAISEFETRHDIQLPDGYRRFLITLGNGGAGPYHGILPLEKWDRVLPGDLPGALSRPSPLRPGVNGIPLEDALGCRAEELFQGAITLDEQGDSYYGLLIVTGPYRGSIVYVDADACCPINFAASDFLAWYETWLDMVRAGEDTKAYGFK
jgi:hypothetical protein